MSKTGYFVELNEVALCPIYLEEKEAEAFATGYLAALKNNEITYEGTVYIVYVKKLINDEWTVRCKEVYA